MDFIEQFLEEKDKNFRGTLLIDSGNISNYLSRGAVDLFDISFMLTDAKDKLRRAKFDLEQKERQITKSFWNKFEADYKDNASVKKPNIAEVERKVKSHYLYIEEYEKVLEAEKVYDFLKVKYDAIKERNDLLKTLSTYKATEMRTLK